MSRRALLLLEVAAIVGLVAWAVVAMRAREPRPPGAIDIKVQLAGARDRALLHQAPDGTHVYRLRLADGSTADLTPEEFARRLHEEQSSRSLLAVLLNVTSPLGFAWVSVGLLGQVLFTGRMLVQWLASEKRGESVVPPAFWWMSLVGATMLLIYFAWRKDPVGLLGQAFGWFIYTRNLWLIHGRRPAPATADPAPEPELPG